MARFKQSFKLGCIFLCLSLQGYNIFSIFAYYNANKVPAQIHLHPRAEIKMQTNCSVTPKMTLISNKFLFTILLWTWPSKHTFPLNQCPPLVDSSGCFFTMNRSMYLEANAVVIHHRDITSKKQLPPTPRPLNQYWIWFNMEPPEHLRKLTIMDNIINLTMSYRSDSNIFTPYGWLESNNEAKKFTLPSKSKFVAWIVSNWSRKQKRVHYFIKLKKHLHVDIYGKYHMPLPRKDHFLILSKYKFYLAFENSVHEDYITEKLWYNAFYAGVVPVVLGPPRKNYERFMPPDSFIHVDDFSSAQELAAYLLRLDKDDQRYRQYFNWRSHYAPAEKRKTWITEYCKVCKTLKEAPTYRAIPSIAEWFK
ncbi:3-galactosyl-N-acetylglucosaminide 4-alpha-L-fucosyltransferase FUT3-like [Rana temporaria]|uniref:3-galactosyl-N-acetylglucosaminide 4-alpha-L-fucosyltransferase FUT3-like n=1 Tax=Rana temporaria TaxID=8407 RepID=UPI001AAC4C27|nr:3-galactosyl-N-acetylglucosaminide 4-alpha-L-fucosyltransferase FUT3-like [Rana temporaria]